MLLVVTHHILLRVTHIYGRLENLHLLARKLSSPHSPDELLSLAREHRAAHNFNSTRSVCLTC